MSGITYPRFSKDYVKFNVKGKLVYFRPGVLFIEAAGLTNEELGAYVRLADFLATNDRLPSDNAQLARIARCNSVRGWLKIRPHLEQLIEIPEAPSFGSAQAMTTSP